MDFAALISQPHFGQLHQDLWVIAMTGGKRGGTFLELGASNGVNLNNTVMLEREYGWTGVCVEANPKSFAQLTAARTAHCIERAVWRTSGDKVQFIAHGVLGAIVDVAFNDMHASARQAHADTDGTIEVETISVPDLMAISGLPPTFDYLSLDVEGAELDVIQAFDFTQHRFALASIEHNAHASRDLIWELLKPHGYQKARVRWEDWFWNPDAFAQLNDVGTAAAADIFSGFAAFVSKLPKK